MKTAIAALALAVLAGCATQAKFAAKMDSFVGRSELDVVAALGQPASVYVAGDGSRVLTYSQTKQIELPKGQQTTPVTTATNGTVNVNGAQAATYKATSTTYVPNNDPAPTIKLWCEARFIVIAGRVSSWSSSGNNCASNG